MTQDEIFELDYQNWQNGHSDEATGEVVRAYFDEILSSVTPAHTNVVVKYANFALKIKKSTPKYSGFVAAGLPEDYVNKIVNQGMKLEAKLLYANQDIRFMIDEHMIWGEREKFLSLVTDQS